MEWGAGVVSPTYVDDGEILVWGPAQVAAATIPLLVAGHCAGLLVESHSCRWLEVRGAGPAALQAMARLPVAFSQGEGWTAVTGAEPRLLVALAGGAGSPGSCLALL